MLIPSPGTPEPPGKTASSACLIDPRQQPLAERDQGGWIWQDVAHIPAMNMAMDEALFQCLPTTTRPILRIYSWTTSCLTIGCFQRFVAARQSVSPETPVIRRCTGGGIVAHGEDLTYSLTVPRTSPLFQLERMESYRFANHILAQVLEKFGISCCMAQQKLAATEDLERMRCFVTPTRYDLLLENGTKIAGAAQRRNAHGYLHQGSLLLTPLGLDYAQIVAALINEFSSRFSSLPFPLEKQQKRAKIATRLLAEKYTTAAWNQRR